MDRRTLLRYLASLAPGAASLPARAQGTFPSRPVRVICGSAVGAALDAATRLYAEVMSGHLERAVIVENMAGASSMLATRTVTNASPDGYTLLTAANTITTIPHLVRNAGYAVKDLSAVGEMARSPSLLVVSGESAFKSIADIVTAARKKPGEVNYASGGQGTTSHLPVELFARQAGISLLHVPYKGNAQAVPDLVANRVGFMMGTATSMAGLIEKGALRILAITSEKRLPQFPDVPTFHELGYSDVVFEIWLGMFGPKGLPATVLGRLGEAMDAARADRNIIHRLEVMGQRISDVRTPAQFQSFVDAEERKYAELIRDAKLVPQ